MSSLQYLIREATDAAKRRGHDLVWIRSSSASGTWRDAECAECGMTVRADAHPAPNGIDIGGPAVALNCDPEGKTSFDSPDRPHNPWPFRRLPRRNATQCGCGKLITQAPPAGPWRHIDD